MCNLLFDTLAGARHLTRPGHRSLLAPRRGFPQWVDVPFHFIEKCQRIDGATDCSMKEWSEMSRLTFPCANIRMNKASDVLVALDR